MHPLKGSGDGRLSFQARNMDTCENPLEAENSGRPMVTGNVLLTLVGSFVTELL